MIKKLPDIQSLKDRRGITINRVGVTDIDFPLAVRRKNSDKLEKVYARVNLYASLPKDHRGTNMSRYSEVLMKWKDQQLSSDSLRDFLVDLKRTVRTKDVYGEFRFKYFLTKQAPVSKKEGVIAYDCTFIGHLSSYNRYRFILEVKVPVTSLCPCSKAIAKAGAHNQRGYITVHMRFDNNEAPWLEELIPLVEKQGSSQVYPILKRVDEKFVTEEAYKNPKFVEDIVRDVALTLQQVKELRWFKVKVTNYESIHDSNATSYVERLRKNKRKWVMCNKSLKGV